MATCHLICDRDAKQSDVDTIKGWLAENGHEVVHSGRIDARYDNYVQIRSEAVKIKAGRLTTAFADADDTELGEGVSVRFRFGDENCYIEKALAFLSKHL